MSQQLTRPATDIDREPAQQFRVIDCDVHHEPTSVPLDDRLGSYLPERWRRYIERYGLRSVGEGAQFSPHRAVGKGAVARLDTLPPSGLEPGSDVDFVREQLLDGHGITAAVLNSFGGLGMTEGNIPFELGLALTRAYNDWTHDVWLESDPRWRASICVPYESPLEAVKEIERCRARSDRFVQVLLPSRSTYPIGNRRYWPIFEAAADMDIPVCFHVGYCRNTSITPCGAPSYYYEYHVDFALGPMSFVPSLIFEGVFDRWPNLAIVLAELGWTWAVPLAWRMDASYRALREDCLELQRKPSEYLWDRFWYTTQPAVQPTHDRWGVDLIEQFERVGAPDKLLFSSDYPHWDFDPPERALPAGVSPEIKRRVLGANAAALYGIELGS
jgi:predicted TIM-barrel fold metal-dependent hydrolase